MRSRRRSAGQIQAAIWRDGLGECAMRHVSPCDGRVDAHHLIKANILRRRGLHEYLMDKRNRLPLCRRHHDQHHLRFRPVPRCLLPDAAWEFAAETGLTYVLDRDYPLEVAA